MAGSEGRKGRRLPEEEHASHDRWLVTYADMITLLMVLFIVLFAMSAVDQKKFEALRSGLAVGFGQSPAILDGGQGVLADDSAAISAIAPSSEAVTVTPDQRKQMEMAVTEHERVEAQHQYAEAEAEVRRLERLMERLFAALRRHGLEDDVRATIDERGLVLSLVSRHVTFEPNVAELSARGREVVDTLAPVLRDLPDKLEIAGHTNQVAVKPKYYDTDWELSAARAVTVLRHLLENDRLPGSRMSATAYGDEKPLIDPRLPGSQAINKRVDIIVMSTLNPESRARLSTVVSDHARQQAASASKTQDQGGNP